MKLRIIVDSTFRPHRTDPDTANQTDSIPVTAGQTFPVKSREWIDDQTLRVSLEESPQPHIETWDINANHAELIEEPQDAGLITATSKSSEQITSPEQELGNDLGCAVWLVVVAFFLLTIPTIQQVSSGNRDRPQNAINGWGWASLTLGSLSLATAGWTTVSTLWDVKAAKNKRLHQAFYQLIETQAGMVSVLQFAQATQLNGTEAKAYLDQAAQKMNASFELGDQGGIFYHFH